MYPNLKAELARKGLSQNDLAETLGIRGASISRKMTGKVGFSNVQMFTIRDELFPELTVDYLFDQRIKEIN